MKLTSGKTIDQAAQITKDKKGIDIVILDLRKVTDITDYFLIASANSNRLLSTIKDSIIRELKKDRGKPVIEGERDWILLDYGDVIIHLFVKEKREYYQIERLWKDAKKQVVDSGS